MFFWQKICFWVSMHECPPMWVAGSFWWVGQGSRTKKTGDNSGNFENKKRGEKDLLACLMQQDLRIWLSALSAEQWLWKHWTLCGKAHLCKSAGQNSNVAPTYSCESSVLFPVVYKGLNNSYLGQNLIPVLQQWTIMTWECYGLVFCCSKMDRE